MINSGAYRLYVFTYIFFSTLVIRAQSDKQAEAPHFKITHWTTDEGLAGNTCVKIFQDREGFLWVGGFDGLIRFDGTQFTVYNKRNILTSNFALAMTGDRQGNLWIGTDHGLVHYTKGSVTDDSDKNHNFYVQSLYLDEAKQKVWIGTRNAGLFTYDLLTHHYESIELPNGDDIVNDILKDADGSFWIASEKNGLQKLKNDKWTVYTKGDGLRSTEIQSLNLDEEGTLFVGTTSGLYTYQAGKKFVELSKFKGIRINKVTKDKNRKLWVGTVNGVYFEAAKNEWRCLTRRDGLSNNDIRDIFFDEDGSVWLGTYRGGLNQLRETKFVTYFNGEEEHIEAVGAVGELDEHRLLIGSTEGALFTLQDSRLKKFPVNAPLHQRIYTLLQDHRKNIWAASYDGLLLISPDGKEKLFTEKDGLMTNQIRIVFQDKKNNYWIGTRNAGLIKMNFRSIQSQPHFEQYKYSDLRKVNATFIMDINEDSKGNLIVCSNNGGVTLLHPDGSLENFSRQNGLESNTCFVAREDTQGTIWVTTTDGLTRIQNGKLFTFTRKDGIPVENPMDVIEDNSGYFWLPTQKGTIRVSRQQLNDYADQKINAVDWKLFDKNNDLERSECTGTGQALRTSDGTIWFPMIGDLMSVNPSVIQISKKAPRVYIDKVAVDEVEAAIDKPVVVPAGSDRVTFDYLAVTLLYPNSAHYKYKLTDFDKDWIDAGSARRAVYTSLPHGQYTFSVMACNNDGVWSASDFNVSVIVEPHFYQTWWFISASVFVVLSGILIYIRVRTNAIKRRSKYLEQLVSERTKLISEQRDKLAALNEELRSSQEEVLAQRDKLAEKIEELAEKNNEIEHINANLEEIVDQRTKVLEDQNKRISEYAFINAHNLRGPLASILGLINLINQEKEHENRMALNKHLSKSAEALDQVVRSINRMLEKEFTDKSSGSKEGSETENKNHAV
jgi:ligand-binding sensor domain-containing protein